MGDLLSVPRIIEQRPVDVFAAVENIVDEKKPARPDIGKGVIESLADIDVAEDVGQNDHVERAAFADVIFGVGAHFVAGAHGEIQLDLGDIDHLEPQLWPSVVPMSFHASYSAAQREHCADTASGIGGVKEPEGMRSFVWRQLKHLEDAMAVIEQVSTDAA